ncbi:hypothetical protein N7540_008502 [Penicillium herquei]|nr:hypothetical protein N7540_008502 [Penicillium herquei]
MVFVDGSPATSPYDIERQIHDLGLEKAFKSTETAAFNITWGEEAEPVDIGNIFQLILRSSGLKAADTYLKMLRPPIFQTLMRSTFNIRIHWSWIYQ